MKRRGRKAPESAVAAKIRGFAAGYAREGRQEYAAGMRHAADVVDGLLGRSDSSLIASLAIPDGLEARVAKLEGRVAELTGGKQPVLNSNGAVQRPARGATKELARVLAGALVPGPSGMRTIPSPPPDAALAPGEERILAAISQRGADGVSNNELTAMVKYRATSLTTYLSNLRAAGYVVTDFGLHVATSAGRLRVEGYEKLPVGADLLAWWLGRISPGEQRILQHIAKASGVVRVGTLIGEATGMRATSVSSYVSKLVAQRLIVRTGQGKVALAPILEPGWGSP